MASRTQQKQQQTSPFPIQTFAQTQRSLLLAEHEAEIASSALATSTSSTSASAATRRSLQASGYALTGLVLKSERTGSGGRIVGEFGADAAVSSSKKGEEGRDRNGDSGEARLGVHGIRVGDVVRVCDVTASSSSRKAGKGKDKDADSESSQGAEGVVTRVGERSVWVAFGAKGKGGNTKEEEAVEELWGKKVWL